MQLFCFIGNYLVGATMIRFRITELLADKQFKEGRRITLMELAEATGINRMTLSRMINTKGYSTVTDNLDKMCAYFGCLVGDIAEYIPEENSVKSSGSDKK